MCFVLNLRDSSFITTLFLGRMVFCGWFEESLLVKVLLCKASVGEWSAYRENLCCWLSSQSGYWGGLFPGVFFCVSSLCQCWLITRITWRNLGYHSLVETVVNTFMEWPKLPNQNGVQRCKETIELCVLYGRFTWTSRKILELRIRFPFFI